MEEKEDVVVRTSSGGQIDASEMAEYSSRVYPGSNRCLSEMLTDGWTDGRTDPRIDMREISYERAAQPLNPVPSPLSCSTIQVNN